MGVRKYYLLGLSDKNIFIYIYIVYLFIFSHVCCSYSVDRFQSVISWGWGWGGGSISKKRSWCLLSPENIHTKVPSRIETASQTQNSGPYFLFFSHPRLLAPCPAGQDRSSLMSVLPPSSDQSVSLTEKVYVSLTRWLLPSITSISKKYV